MVGRLDVDKMLDELEPWQFEEWIEAIRAMSPKRNDRMVDPQTWLTTHAQHIQDNLRRRPVT